MSWDIYGRPLRRGYCEVHPRVREHYPCSCCEEETRAYQAEYDAWCQQQQEPQPCESCYYATGEMQDCDGTCERLPMAEWDYFKAHPDQLDDALAAEAERIKNQEVPF